MRGTAERSISSEIEGLKTLRVWLRKSKAENVNNPFYYDDLKDEKKALKGYSVNV